MNVKDRLEALNKLGNVPDVSPHYNATRYGPSNDERNKKIAKMNVCLDGFKVWCEHIMLLLSFNDSHHTAFNDIATKTLVYHSQGGFYQEGYAKMQSILDTAKSDLESAIVSEKGDFGNEERRHN